MAHTIRTEQELLHEVNWDAVWADWCSIRNSPQVMPSGILLSHTISLTQIAHAQFLHQHGEWLYLHSKDAQRQVEELDYPNRHEYVEWQGVHDVLIREHSPRSVCLAFADPNTAMLWKLTHA